MNLFRDATAGEKLGLFVAALACISFLSYLGSRMGLHARIVVIEKGPPLESQTAATPPHRDGNHPIDSKPGTPAKKRVPKYRESGQHTTISTRPTPYKTGRDGVRGTEDLARVKLPVSLNRATYAHLIAAEFSPEAARNILAYRQKHGMFESLETLLKVPGVTRSEYFRSLRHLRIGE